MLGLAIAAVLYATFDGVPEPTDGERVGPAVTVVDGYVAAFVLDAGDGTVVLIDAGQDPDAAPIVRALARMDRRPEDVTAILLTHGHEDHRGGVARFPRARIYAHEDEIPLLAGEVAADGPIPRLSGRADPLRVTHPVRDGEVIALGELEAQAFHLPGHTRGSVAWWIGGTLFLGDSATSLDTGELAPSPWVFSDDTARNRASLAALPDRLAAAGREVRLSVFSHAAPVRGMEPLRELADACRSR